MDKPSYFSYFWNIYKKVAFNFQQELKEMTEGTRDCHNTSYL